MSDAEQGKLAALLAGDWAIPTDDGLCGRLVGCTVCSSAGPGFFDIGTLDNGLTIAYRVCNTCQRKDPNREQVAALLEQRYSTQGETQA